MSFFIPKISFFIHDHPKGVVVVTGPTCSGKTKIAVDMALQYNGEVINADSRQMFQDLSLTTASPTENEKCGVPHHLFECIAPNTSFTVVDFKKMADETIKDVLKRGKTPVICGGTGLYINAITKGFSFGTCPPHFELREKLEKFSTITLWEMLFQKDPQKAEKIGVYNRKYLIRALEIFETLQSPDKPRREAVPYDFFLLGVALPRKTLYEKINARVEKMFLEGFLEEVSALVNKYPDIPQLDSGFNAHGVPEALQYFSGEISLEELKEKMKQNTRKYAKRQLTWWRKDERILWVLGDTGAEIHIRSEEF